MAISSLNRESYTARLSMATFKESGAIEYSSDVLLGLQFRLPPGVDNLSQDTLDDLKQSHTAGIGAEAPEKPQRPRRGLPSP